MKVALIVAMSRNRVIGRDRDLPWHLPDDMKFFTGMTKGQTVIMGRKNYESIPHKYRPLPDRKNIVVTRKEAYSAPGCTVVHSIAESLKTADLTGEIYIIGGGEIYRQSLEQNLVDIMYITEVDAEIEGDTYFPKIDLNLWNVETLKVHPSDERHEFGFTIKKYLRKEQ